ncbi:alkylresorcinol/alkylpyrone synthase [Rubritalea squalenifaciens DSM 18772]|uniref:Alkylresorcinol/alkylpyrone synthase n=1 Tax=Rubritalea squalenifaciens DSM 18772 TaxID=1123071 RepID=A0A1M6GQE4_9BACT|nr:3-oxoacyl-[acyl-carrier-protein] synthase III C-terminal domain-containing protein [Rubritalea squalenifaciens]SHJ12100.1 alkylresorcinol/alkylpyrone synthase [Rubritalea squalenifaciens DSM 18772]
MYLHSIASHFPAHRFTQQESFSALSQTKSFANLKRSSQALLEKILTQGIGIDSRHFCVSDIAGLVDADAGELNALFEREGRALAAEAMRKALKAAGLEADELDALIVCTCTGYLCPGLSSHVAELLGMRSNLYLQDLVGLGCGAAVPALRSAHGLSAADPEAKIGVIAVELCSSAFFMDDDPGVLISLCLFGDGASASIWSGESLKNAWRASGFQTLHLPEHRDMLRFENQRGFLRNRLDRKVPELAAQAVKHLISEAGMDPASVVAHGGGRDVVQALEAALGGVQLKETREVLREYGNLSSPSVLVALQRLLEKGTERDSLWLTSFGAGFAAHALQLHRNHG